MILTGNKILKEMQKWKKRILIRPFNPNNLNPNSYDVTIGKDVLTYVNEFLDPRSENPTEKVQWTRKMDEYGNTLEYIDLERGKVYLFQTAERVKTDKYVTIVYGKSSLGRLGLFIHATAGYIDIGFHGNVTLELVATQPIRIYKGMKIGQLVYYKTKGKVNLYNGKYQGARGAEASKFWIKE